MIGVSQLMSDIGLSGVRVLKRCACASKRSGHYSWHYFPGLVRHLLFLQ